MIYDRLLSNPVRLRWAGWESDTYRLQQAGWSISADQDNMRCQMRLALEHPDQRTYGISAAVDWRYARHPTEFQEMFRHRQLPVDIRFGRDITFHNYGPLDFRPVDAQPQFTNAEVKHLRDFAHFAPLLARTRPIVVPEESVDELMERILKLQQPGREEHFRKLAAEGDRLDVQPRQKFHAQIISLVA